MLGFVGLDGQQESAYRMLVKVDSVSTADAALRLGLPEAEAAALLRDLERRGLAASSGGDAGHYMPAPPRMALGGLMAQRRHEFALAESAFYQLVEDYRTGAAADPAADGVGRCHHADTARLVRARAGLGAPVGDPGLCRGARPLKAGMST